MGKGTDYRLPDGKGRGQPELKRYIGLDIGGTKCAVVLGDENGTVLKKISFPTEDVETTLARLLDETEAMQKASEAPVQSVGISCGGPLDPVRGVIQSPPNLPGWDNIEIVRLIRERTGLNAVLTNDANACALAEWRFGAGRGCNNMVFLTFGTGFGAGIIMDGRLLNGANGNAGEIGHVRLEPTGPIGYGKAGSAEGFASGGGIAQLGKTAALECFRTGAAPAYCPTPENLPRVNAKAIAQAAENGDETAIAVYRRSGEMLGRALSILVDVLNPERIVIGSIYRRSAALLQEAMERVMKEECLPAALSAVTVLPAELGEEIGDRAALSLAMMAE